MGTADDEAGEEESRAVLVCAAVVFTEQKQRLFVVLDTARYEPHHRLLTINFSSDICSMFISTCA